ncbi:hypothetical protein BIY37_11700 [Candidatus Brocadia sapporoensis]|uniref:Carboxypeptidase regulatory-like domain-containing protein n=1 Tax=Candidatus Brocadia sapporoensis TaxID=392547 RepID=A0A1V6LXD6_9BACT|nr:carboxypeptidase-like regulatory domain-containing protein [Candidatus Brocadia sapporoensis]MDG6006328.1 carboxypeptidase regulatory-like domain-containing protein [Candidatus Brocadia sp.]OQD44811.1 hypothetical protein BIY37_11700 [Candidatus Brocadia sapporoensis]GJQ22439.1 MAG: hypothetical protein HBSAPP01_02290 [Candidatus Brocadia sapporoensis]
MVKITAIVLLVFMVFFSIGYGDTIILRNNNTNIELKITNVRKEYINAILPRKSIKSLSMEFLNSKNYPDVIIMNSNNTAMECKIKEIAEDYIRLQIPASEIVSLAVSSPSENDKKIPVVDMVTKEATTESAEGKVSEPRIADDVKKAEVGDWLRTSSEERENREKNYRFKVKKPKGESPSGEDKLVKPETEFSSFGESVTDEKTREMDADASESNKPQASEPGELMDKERKKIAKEEQKKDKPIDQDPNLGRVEGRILHSGKPLPDCQVKLQMLEKGGLLAKGYRPVEGALEIETLTDKEGVYRFMNVSPGLYKVYWKPPSEAAWIRRFKMEPDVVVNSGRLTNPKEIETLKRTLN